MSGECKSDDGVCEASATPAPPPAKGQGEAETKAAEDGPVFHLEVSEWIAAEAGAGAAPEPELAAVNVALVFQVNCPGCFMYALPDLARLHDELEGAGAPRARVMAVATAFEDYLENSAENARALVQERRVVGETLKYYRRDHPGRLRDLPGGGHAVPSLRLPFPVAFDLVERRSDRTEDLVSEATDEVNRMIAENPHLLRGLPKYVLVERVAQHLGSRPFRAATFGRNHLRGTPSWVVFDARRRVLASWMGHRPYAEVLAKVEALLRAA